ncbi:hypothetical protein AXG93_4242s1000 [Marchantia polymorpha subsp. ruderalis]|uniref:CCHC-type domain-containing protein n=1 Tax=Marchantia polymorpha subsp. ruderalis TaxID=1480154 RepID=A0A176VVJ1_MARPO|nr:hypothetical protein AXG93_4242s1000 [Marchantia polymorpha subsp. ruderalis]
MALRGSHRNGWSSGEEEDPDEREEDQDRDEGGRIGRPLCSTFVCVRPDAESAPHSPSLSPPSKVVNLTEDIEHSGRIEHLNTDRLTVSHRRDLEKGKEAIRVLKGVELERGVPPGKDRGTIRFSRSSRERDAEIPTAEVRDSDRDRATQRDYPQKDRLRDRDEGFRREIGRRESEKLPDVGHIRDQDQRRLVGDVKGKEKRYASDDVRGTGYHKERTFSRDGGSFNQHDRGHNSHSLRRDRVDSHSSEERDAESPRFNSRNEGPRSSRQDDLQNPWKERNFRGERRNEIDRGRDKHRDRGDGPLPELYSIHKATVHSIRPFGLFVKLDGYRNHGLVHISQVSDHEVTKRDDPDAVKVEALSSVAAEGESIYVKVISVKTEEDGSVKVGCSLNLWNPSSSAGTDKRNLVACAQMQLEAVYNVTCTRCGGHGHLRKECYSSGDKTYDLLQEGDDSLHGEHAKDNGNVVYSALSLGQSSRAPSGPVGRGRAMVQPAWMKHGVRVGDDADKVLGRRTSAGANEGYKDEAALPEKVTTVQEALAVIAKLKEEKHRKRDEKRERKSHKSSKKHNSKDGKRDKHRKRHSSDDEYKSRKKYRI